MYSYDVVEHGKPLQLQIRETPVPKGQEVLVRISHAGLCHSDIHFWDGYFDLGGGKKAMLSDRGVKPPFTMGHEPLGIVVAVGEEVRGIDIGSRRLVYPWIGCGQCWACKAELDNLCPTQKSIGVGRPGAFSSHILVPDAKYLVDVDGLEDGVAAPLACSGLTSYAAVTKVGNLHPGDAVAVIGCGGVGMAAISILRAKGVEKVIACDVDQKKLDSALDLGATTAILSNRPDATQRLAQAADGRLAAAIDFVGMPATFDLAYYTLRKGGKFVLCGLHGGGLSVPMPPIAQRSISILGSFVGTLGDLRETVALAKSGKLAPPPYTVRPGSQINEALDDLIKGRVIGRTVLDFTADEPA
jgi:alcohol dehydrogenase, propanol-preferring